MQPFSKYTVPFIFGSATIVYIIGLFINVMDVDAAQYASISREMVDNGSFLQVLHRGQNYLDKPPLLFWLSALSFKFFGISNVAFKLPTFLFTVLGVYSTFRIGKLLYNYTTGIVAAIILYTCQAFFLFNNDVRTDALLTANVAFACWQLLEFSGSRKWSNLLLGFGGVALAMMAKGPIGAVVPASALLAHFAFRRELKKLMWWQWYAGIVFALILMLPMLYGLQQQYGSAGPEFFFWTQSFGRITGENVWHNNAGPFFFLHNFLWSFLPWALPASVAFLVLLYRLLAERFRTTAIPEVFALGGFLLPFIALSLSHYKLPHYIFVVYPLCAVFTAGFICGNENLYYNLFRWLRFLQLAVSILLIAGAVFLSSYIFPSPHLLVWIVTLFLVLMVLHFFFRSKSSLEQLIAPAAMAIITVNFLFSAHVYPALLKYQFGSEMAAIVKKENIPVNQLYFYKCYSHSFEFYAKTIVPALHENELDEKKKLENNCWIIGGEDLLKELKKENLQPQQQFEVNDYSVSLLTITFLNPETRQESLKKMYLVKL
ncbi:MAG: glycosyltransferase family 39 protein [Chitinophagales bacterium]